MLPHINNNTEEALSLKHPLDSSAAQKRYTNQSILSSHQRLKQKDHVTTYWSISSVAASRKAALVSLSQNHTEWISMITKVATVEQQECIIDPATKTHFSVSGLNGVTADGLFRWNGCEIPWNTRAASFWDFLFSRRTVKVRRSHMCQHWEAMYCWWKANYSFQKYDRYMK